MEAQLNQPKTYGAQDYAQTFFQELPTDARFLQNTFQKFPPTSSLATKTIEFKLNRFEAANIYQIQETHIQVCVKITKSDGSLPDTEKFVAPVNNILHSLFEAVRVKVNDDLVGKNVSYYPYKAYITNCLTYSSSYKAAQLASEGFFQDSHTHMEPGPNSTGFQERNLLFRKENRASSAYDPNGARFFGRLQLDLSSSTCGLPPGTKVQIELDRSSDEFVLLKQSTDTESYKLVLLDCNLFVPVAQLSAPLYSEIASVFSHKSIGLHFRRIEIKCYTLPKESEEYNSEVLFQDDLPCRIVLCFIESNSKIGDQTKNPFNFQRQWEKPKAPSSNVMSRERLLEEKLNAMQKKLARFESLLDLDEEMTNQIDEFRKSAGKGKRSQSLQASQGSSTIFSRLRSSFAAAAAAAESSETDSSHRGTPPPDYSENDIGPLEEKQYVHVKQVELSLNGNSIDALDTRETRFDCMPTYWKMFQMGGFGRTLFTNGITYDMFR